MASRKGQWMLKRMIEWPVALVLFLLSVPVQLLIALAIRIDSPGPAVFVQERLGRDGKPFRMLKFRTLRWEPGAAPVLNPDRSTRVARADPRVTRVGRWLRTGMDELPQLLNVLKGDMAIIGPRPDEVFHLQYYSEEAKRKLSVLPGITGLPQVSGRNDLPWKERIKLDVFYIENYSLGLDCKIGLKTLRSFFVPARGNGRP